MIIRGNIPDLLYTSMYQLFFTGELPPLPAEDPAAVAKAHAERDADPEGYDRMTIGMMPRIPR